MDKTSIKACSPPSLQNFGYDPDAVSKWTNPAIILGKMKSWFFFYKFNPKDCLALLRSVLNFIHAPYSEILNPSQLWYATQIKCIELMINKSFLQTENLIYLNQTILSNSACSMQEYNDISIQINVFHNELFEHVNVNPFNYQSLIF